MGAGYGTLKPMGLGLTPSLLPIPNPAAERIVSMKSGVGCVEVPHQLRGQQSYSIVLAQAQMAFAPDEKDIP